MAYICNQISPISAANLLVLIEAQLILAGWSLHDRMIPFTAGKNPGPLIGDELEGVISGAKANITNIVVTSGAWVTNNAAGYFGLTNVTGQFQAEVLKNNTHILNPQATTTGVYHIICSSNAESGNELIQYIDMAILASTITVTLYMWWDNTTHAGNSKTSSGYTITYAAGGIYILVGDKDLFLVRRVAAAGDCLFGHIPKRFYPNPFATLTAPCGAGMGIVLNVDNTTKFVLNQTYWICGAAGEGRWRGNVIGLGPGTITVDNLGSAFAAGAKIGAMPSLFGIMSATDVFNVTFDRIVTGTGNVGGGFFIGPITGTITIFDPDESLGLALAPYNTPGLYILQPIFFYGDNTGGTLFAASISDSIFLTPPLAVAETSFGTTSDGAPLGNGTATGGAAFTLIDAGKAWGLNVFQNKIVVIASGTGTGQSRKIASNDGTTLTINTTWNTIPNATSVYYIYDSVYRVCTTWKSIAYKEEI